MTIQDITENYEEGLLIADGFYEAILGVDESQMKVVYSVKKCLEILERTMPEEEAIDYFHFNVSGSYVGDNTPIWCNDNF